MSAQLVPMDGFWSPDADDTLTMYTNVSNIYLNNNNGDVDFNNCFYWSEPSPKKYNVSYRVTMENKSKN